MRAVGLILFLAFLAVLGFVVANYELIVENFEVTAYYGPVPGQDYYVAGRTFAQEVRFQGAGITTKYGRIPQPCRTLAADPRLIPLNTIIIIPSAKPCFFFIMEDIGERIKGKKLDIFMGHAEWGRDKAVLWGRQKIKIVAIKRRGR